jgi:cytidine deaminase
MTTTPSTNHAQTDTTDRTMLFRRSAPLTVRRRIGFIGTWSHALAVTCTVMTPDTGSDTGELFEAARSAQERAYAPYSRFPVGAAVRTAGGTIFAGCNVENAAYPQGSCAETGAISAMIAGGERSIVEVVVVTDGETISTCCGGCRQRIREFAGPETPIRVADGDGIRATFTLEQLLPHSFGPENLDGF